MFDESVRRSAYPVSPAVQAQGIAAALANPEPRPVPDGTLALPPPQMAPAIERAQPTTVKVDLETRKVTGLMNDGIAYEYWTFNGTVPGPMLRVMQGDTVELTLKNAADSGLTHSIDLHAVLGPGGGAKSSRRYRPRKRHHPSFRPCDRGVYVYHCATPMVSMHIASGMYGLIVVEPPGGLPRVDHEFYVSRATSICEGDRGTAGLRQFDMNKMPAAPDYVVFNGHVGALTATMLLRRMGESVRCSWWGGPT
jgi:nitrite reductase (NO-forming)